MTLRSLFEAIPTPDPASFDGSDYDAATDDERLTGQIRRVYEVMRDGRWRTLQVISTMADAPQSSVSAQLRHLRKERFGSYLVERRQVREHPGLWEYRLGGKGEGIPHGAHLVTSEQERALRAADSMIPFLRHGFGCRCLLPAADGFGQCTCGLTGAWEEYRDARKEARR